VPHHKIKEILRTASPDELQVAAFLRGYGLSPKELATMARELRVLALCARSTPFAGRLKNNSG
jgi:hypothetical protein